MILNLEKNSFYTYHVERGEYAEHHERKNAV